MKSDENGNEKTAANEEQANQAEVKPEAKTASARKGGSGKTSAAQPEQPAAQPARREEAREPRQASGPWVYVGPRDPRKQLRPKTAYLQIPAGMNKDLFVPLDDYPAWEEQQKEAGK